jgi:hypothetical protein
VTGRDLAALLNVRTPPNPGRPKPWVPPVDHAGQSVDDTEPYAGAPLDDHPDPVPPPPGREPEGLNDAYDDAEDGAEDGAEDDAEPPLPRLSADELTPRLARLSLDAKELREPVTAWSADRRIEVTADVAGRLLALTVEPEAVRTLHSRRLAQEILETVNAARDGSGQRAMDAAIRRLGAAGEGAP